MVYVFVASGMERRLRAAYGPDAGHRGRWQMGGELDGVEVVPPIALWSVVRLLVVSQHGQPDHFSFLISPSAICPVLQTLCLLLQALYPLPFRPGSLLPG